MDRGLLIKQLQAAPVAIRTAEEKRDDKVAILIEAQREFEEAKRHCLLNDYLTGKNEAIREAQLAEKTLAERIRVEELEFQVRVLNREVKFQERMFQALVQISEIYVAEINVVKQT
jgi:flagellar biosynthesis/type III secretory pathway protein FliH